MISASFSCGDGGAALTTAIFKNIALEQLRGAGSPPQKHPQAPSPALALLVGAADVPRVRGGICRDPLEGDPQHSHVGDPSPGLTGKPTGLITAL